MARPTLQPHSGQVNVRITFQEVYDFLSNNGLTSYTTNRGTPFTAEAGIVKKGNRKGQLVIIFRRGRRESARAYLECWGHITNANRTYIDSYTAVI